MNEESKLPKSWEVKKLGEVCDIQTGKHDANHASSTGEFRFYTCAFEFMFCNTKRFNGESLILPGNGANVGEVFYYNGEFDAYQRTYVLNKIKTLPKFLYYHMLCHWKKRNHDKQFGSATNYIRMGNFTDYKIAFPPILEQQTIVTKIEELFSQLENGKQQLLTAQKQLKTYRQSLLKSAFEGKLTNPNLKAGELPKGWEVKKLGEITSVLGDGLHGTPKYCEQGEYYFINGNNLTDGRIEIKKNTKRVGFDEFKKYKKPLNEKTILISINGTLGYTAFYSNENVILGKSACYFNVQDSVDKYYIRHFLTSNSFVEYANKNATGSTIKNIGLKAMRELQIAIPPLSKQQEIVAILESKLTICDKIEETIKTSLQQSETLRQSILKKAFEGRLV